jgi:hypothetical protein
LVLNTIKALTIVKPDTVIRWHGTGCRSYWRWKSRHRCGRPLAPLEIHQLVREMSIVNPLWGAPRLHGELLKLGIEIGQTSVARYMAQEPVERVVRPRDVDQAVGVDVEGDRTGAARPVRPGMGLRIMRLSSCRGAMAIDHSAATLAGP